MQPDNNISLKAKIKQEFSLREFIMKYFHVIPWALVTISISLAVVYIKIRYTNPIYQASGKIIVKSENNNGSSKGKFSELYMMHETRLYLTQKCCYFVALLRLDMYLSF